MSTTTITTPETLIPNTDTYVIGSLLGGMKIFLSHTANDSVVRVDAENSTIEVATKDNHRIGFVKPGMSAIFSLSDGPEWKQSIPPADFLPALTLPAADAAFNTSPFGFTEAQANALIAAVRNMGAALTTYGLYKAE